MDQPRRPTHTRPTPTDPTVGRGTLARQSSPKALLASDDAAWEALRPQMNAANDAEFEALRTDWLAGTPTPGSVDTASADAFLKVMNDLGGAELVGEATTLPEGLFVELE